MHLHSILRYGALRTWINEPSFLRRTELESYDQPGCGKSEVVLPAFVSEVSESPLLALVNHYSDLYRLLRAVAKQLQIKAYQSRIQQGLSTEKDKSILPCKLVLALSLLQSQKMLNVIFAVLFNLSILIIWLNTSLMVRS